MIIGPGGQYISLKHIPARLWHCRTLMESNAVWMRKYIIRRDPDKAYRKAKETAHYGNIILRGLEGATNEKR